MGKGNVYTEGYAFGCDKAIAIFSFFRVCVYVCTAKSFQYKLLYFQEFPWRPFFLQAKRLKLFHGRVGCESNAVNEALWNIRVSYFCITRSDYYLY